LGTLIANRTSRLYTMTRPEAGDGTGGW